jgi:hypothetical protein
MQNEINMESDKCKDITLKESDNVLEVIKVMANIINYLSVSLYENEFTKNHEDSYAILHSIYDAVALTPSKTPSFVDCENFYNNFVYLKNVTYTDDPDYYTFKRTLRKYIISMKK